MPIQGSAVPRKHVFSSGKETTTARRNRIQLALMEALQILKFGIKQGHVLNFTQGTTREEELRELEMDTFEPVPASMTEYSQYLATTSTDIFDENWDSDEMYVDD